jgi:hypothetical protein
LKPKYVYFRQYLKRRNEEGEYVMERLGSENDTNHEKFNWSLESHERISRRKEFQMKRQLSMSPLSSSKNQDKKMYV